MKNSYQQKSPQQHPKSTANDDELHSFSSGEEEQQEWMETIPDDFVHHYYRKLDLEHGSEEIKQISSSQNRESLLGDCLTGKMGDLGSSEIEKWRHQFSSKQLELAQSPILVPKSEQSTRKQSQNQTIQQYMLQPNEYPQLDPNPPQSSPNYREAQEILETIQFLQSTKYLKITSKYSITEEEPEEPEQQKRQDNTGDSHENDAPIRKYSLSQQTEDSLFEIQKLDDQNYLKIQDLSFGIDFHFVKYIAMLFIDKQCYVPLPTAEVFREAYRDKFINVYFKHIYQTDSNILKQTVRKFHEQKQETKSQPNKQTNTSLNMGFELLKDISGLFFSKQKYSKAQILKSHVYRKYTMLLKLEPRLHQKSDTTSSTANTTSTAGKRNDLEIQLCVLEMMIGFQNCVDYCEQQHLFYQEKKKDIVAKIWKQRAKQAQKQGKLWIMQNQICINA